MNDNDKSKMIAEQIEALILQTADPTDKGMLLVLSKIATSLDENTKITKQFSADFKRHEETEMALINQGRGAVRVALLALAVFQGAFVWYGKKHVEQVDGLAAQIATNTREIAVHKEHHRQEERTRAK